jgi:glutamate/tyrosine decarboxylase-like PLP-dependent enzyme
MARAEAGVTMMSDAMGPLLETTREIALGFLASIDERPVGARAPGEALRAALSKPLADDPQPAVDVVRALAEACGPGLVASAGPRYFGFVTGGSLPAALAADWLASAWDQNAAMHVMSPAAAVVEEVTARWLLDIFGLPRDAGVGFVTGCQMANVTCLAAARHAVLERAGWDVESRGLRESPPLRVVVGAQAHVTIGAALALLGLGRGTVVEIPSDDQGRLRADALAHELDARRLPTIVCAQAGNVNTGAFDPLDTVARLCRAEGAWLHVDGAFGLWAAASPMYRHHLRGAALADSWATDAHKWLNVPYDSGVAIVADAAAQRASMGLAAPYLAAASGERDGLQYVPESSRRARALPIYAALGSLGRSGLAALVERCSALARRMGHRLAASPSLEILNDVVLNQVLVRVRAPERDPERAEALTARIVARVQQEGTCWVGGSRWLDRAAFRVSVSNWSTTGRDIDRSADAILRIVEAETGTGGTGIGTTGISQTGARS